MPRPTLKKPCIYVLGLGGTIAALAKHTMDEFYERASININELITSLPLDQEKISIVSEQLLQQISHEMTHEELVMVAKRIDEIANMDEVDGIVVSQGTNSIEETAYFMNLVINTSKPIVFTGSFRPINALGYDGSRNLYNAILIASHRDAIGIGVVLTFDDHILSSRETSKLDPSNIGGFTTNELAKIGFISGQDVKIHSLNHKKHTYLSEFNINKIEKIPAVYIIYGHLGADDIFVDAALEHSAKGIISAGMGKGYQPVILTNALNEAIQKGIIVVRCSRSGQGNINVDLKLDHHKGTIAGGSLSPQKARILLAVALSQTNDKTMIQQFFDQY